MTVNFPPLLFPFHPVPFAFLGDQGTLFRRATPILSGCQKVLEEIGERGTFFLRSGTF